MNRSALRIIVGILWSIIAIVYVIQADYLMAALFLLVGIVFIFAAKRDSNKK